MPSFFLQMIRCSVAGPGVQLLAGEGPVLQVDDQVTRNKKSCSCPGGQLLPGAGSVYGRRRTSCRQENGVWIPEEDQSMARWSVASSNKRKKQQHVGAVAVHTSFLISTGDFCWSRSTRAAAHAARS